MKIFRLAIIILLTSGCVSCGVYQLSPIPESRPLLQPALINHPGILTHSHTGFAFSEQYGNFQRVTAYRYDTAGVDISIGYNNRSLACFIAATFYIYPAPQMSFIGASPAVVASLQENWLRAEFARSKAGVKSAHPKLREISIQNSVIPVGESLVQGPSFTFAESGHLSELHLFLYNKQWFVKYRFTYPESCEAEASTRLKSLALQLPWATAQQGVAPDRARRRDR